jgi:butyryl-CoA dehydrogenase
MTHEDVAASFNENVVRNTADFAARTIISGIEKNKQRVLIGGDAKFMDRMTRLFPVTATKFLSRLVHKWSE